MHDRTPRRSAFTLIEVMVVVAIIAALIAILLPSMGKAVDTAQSAACLSNLHQMHTAQLSFAAEHFGSAFKHRSAPTASGNNPEDFWFGQLLRRMGTTDEKTMFCPTASELNLNPARGYPGFGDATHAWGWPGAWSNQWVSDFTGSYMYNAWMYDIAQSTWLPSGARGPAGRYWQRISRIDQAGNVPVFVDGAWCEGWPLHTDTTNGNLYDPYNPWTGIEMSRVTMRRHVGTRTNVVTADGAARTIALRELWTLKWHQAFDTTTGYDPE